MIRRIKDEEKTEPRFGGVESKIGDGEAKGQLQLGGLLNKDEVDALNGWSDRTNLTKDEPNTGDSIVSDAAKSWADRKADSEKAVANFKAFEYGNQGQLDAIMQSILNREKFNYDLNGDALYQQYKDRYAQQANMAMNDAIGMASTMTGGYGNSYAQSVGQQMYQKEMQGLNDIVPELYQMALDRYNAEGQQMYDQYGMLVDDYNRAYGEHLDEYNKLLTERDYVTNEYYNSIPKDTSITNIEDIQGWRDAVLGAETEEEAMTLIEKLETIDPALAYELNILLEDKRKKELQEGSNPFSDSLHAGLGILGAK